MSPWKSDSTEWWEGRPWLEPGLNSGILVHLTGCVTLGSSPSLSECNPLRRLTRK